MVRFDDWFVAGDRVTSLRATEASAVQAARLARMQRQAAREAPPGTAPAAQGAASDGCQDDLPWLGHGY